MKPSGPAACAGDPVTAPVPSPNRDGSQPWLVRYPLAAVAVVGAVWIGWQLPALAGAARANAAVAVAYHGTVVAAGLLFWLQLIGSRPVAPAAPPLRRLALLVATVGVTTIGGMVLVFGSAVLYPGYANQWHHVMTVLDDQQLAGAVYWMGAAAADRRRGGGADLVAERGGVGGAVGRAGPAADPAQGCLVGSARYEMTYSAVPGRRRQCPH